MSRLGITSRRDGFSAKKTGGGGGRLNSTGVIPPCFNPAFTQICFPPRGCGYPRPPSPAALLRVFTHRLVLVLQTAGSHIRHGGRCCGDSGFHSSTRCEPPGQTAPAQQERRGTNVRDGEKTRTSFRFRDAREKRYFPVDTHGFWAEFADSSTSGSRVPWTDGTHAPADYGSQDVYALRS